ncbi:MAG: hypothetical protein K2K87_00085 [Lachnospiraceae bacterium]|nr:hypothetical protein [Lachnospiraceae bacterium]
MSRSDKTFYQRLERIREDLDAYISLRFSGESANVVSLFEVDNLIETKMEEGEDQLVNRTEHWDAVMVDDKYEEASHPDTVREKKQKEKGSFSCQSPVTLQNPRIRKQTAGAPAKRRKIPGFLSEGEKHAQIDKVLDQKEESFSTRLLRLIDEKGLKDSAVYKSANIDRRLFSRIRSNEDYMPSKKTAISFCLALQLEMDETKKLLETAGYTLSASSRFDLIIMYLIENSEYNIHFANMVLDDYGEGTLSR